MIPAALEEAILKTLSEKISKNLSLSSVRPLSGGDINDAYALQTSAGAFFMKYNDAGRYPAMFEKEALGLELLRNAAELKVPSVVGFGETKQHSFLILEFIDSAEKRGDFWAAFGTSLAKMHGHFGEGFGLDHDNYIGSLYQCNNFHNDWISFFIEERLLKMIKQARDDGLIGQSVVAAFERLFVKLPQIIPVEPPSLIHGDLWSGNYMVGPDGRACIIDPAVYYGHREMDIGMSRLFGAFGSEFYQAYQQEYPMEQGWQERMNIHNLYPLMVHVNLFGRGYVGSVQSILSQF